jgi:hypothetical protein
MQETFSGACAPLKGNRKELRSSGLVEEDITIVYLIRAHNSLWKSLLLLAILGVGWHLIDFMLNHIS